jgi:hypothetical protein
MKKILFLAILAGLLMPCCKTPKKLSTQMTKQGIAGYVFESAGNQMPMKDAQAYNPKGLQTTVYVYELTNIQQVDRIGETPYYKAIHTRPVTSIQSDSTGSFTIQLAPGRYSLFIRPGENFYSNLFDGEQNIFPVEVIAGKQTQVKFIYDTGTH